METHCSRIPTSYKGFSNCRRQSTRSSKPLVKIPVNVSSDINAEPLLEPAILSAIIFIDYDDCWLTPCGHWKGPSKITKKFEDLKMSFHGKSPSKDFLSQDFSTVFKNTKMLMEEDFKKLLSTTLQSLIS